MIDLHCHILPGVDDGAETMEDSVALARLAVEDGITTVVATPHAAEWAYTGDAAETKTRVTSLSQELGRRGIEFTVLPGLEVFLTPDVPALLDQGRIFTLNNSRYILVEFPVQMLPPYAEQTLFEIQLRRLVPIIAHPERNAAIEADLGILEKLVDRGMLAQVTATSLTGGFGARPKAVAEQMVARQLVHVIASDAHASNGRSPRLSGAVKRAGELVGHEAAVAMVSTIPDAILHDRDVQVPERRPAPGRSWFPFGR